MQDLILHEDLEHEDRLLFDLIISYLTNSDFQKYLFLGYKMVIEFQHMLLIYSNWNI